MPAAETVPRGSNPHEALAALARELARVTVQVRSGGRGGGAGVVWRRDGLVVTNAHVVRGDAEIELADGRRVRGRLCDRDERHDLAALTIPATDLPAAEHGDARALRPGELVLAFGHPFGVANALAVGVVHAGAEGEKGASRWIQADIRLAPGYSGGPLSDARGRIVGLNAMIVGGLGFAVPTHTVERFLLGAAAQPRLGVTLRPVPVSPRKGEPARTGWLVLETETGGPADAAGVLAGDLLIAVDGEALDGAGALGDRLDLATPGDHWRIELVRGGASLLREVVLGSAARRRRAA